MGNRINMQQTAPDGYKAMLGFERYLANASLTNTHKDLIKIRASQINGCAYCINLHTKEARQHGESEQRIYALNAWRDTPFFTEEEMAVLALTEEVTLITNHVKDETYNNAASILGPAYLAEVIFAAITINAWNRIGIATGMQPVV